MLLKKAKESWKGNFDKVLASTEKKEFANARRYYEGEYLKAIEDFQMDLIIYLEWRTLQKYTAKSM